MMSTKARMGKYSHVQLQPLGIFGFSLLVLPLVGAHSAIRFKYCKYNHTVRVLVHALKKYRLLAEDLPYWQEKTTDLTENYFR